MTDDQLARIKARQLARSGALGSLQQLDPGAPVNPRLEVSREPAGKAPAVRADTHRIDGAPRPMERHLTDGDLR